MSNENILEALNAMQAVASETAESLKAKLDRMEAARIAALPLATEEQMAALYAARKGTLQAKVKGLNDTFRLSEVQEAQLRVADAEHATYINSEQVKKEIVDTVTKSRLVRYKYRIGAKGLSFKLSGRA